MEHVLRRAGRYFWRARVPADLVGRVGRREIVRRLDTADPHEARSRAARLTVRVLDLWEEARAMVGTAEEVRQLVSGLLDALDHQTHLRGEALPRRPSMLALHSLEEERRLTAEIRADLPDLVRRIAAAEADAGNTARAGAIAGALDPATLGHLRDLLGTLGVRSAATPTATAIRFLEDIYTPERRLREDAHRHVDGYIRLFVRVAGDKPLADYKRADVTKWVRILEKLRTSYGKRKGDDTKSIAELVKESRDERTLNRTTVEKHITHLKAYFLSGNQHYRWCHREDIEDLFRDIPLSAHVPGARLRKSWTIDQLGSLFASPIWSGTRSRRQDVTRRFESGPQIHRDAYWWLPVAALWTGARLEELAQLQHSDVASDRDGIAYLRIHDEGDRKIKTAHSVRNVPIHRFLISIGFLDLFHVKKRGRIWPELKKHGRPPSWGALYSSHFTDYRRACGFYEPLRDFHSLRRTFITMMRTRAGIDPLTVAAIVGHDDSDPEFKKVQQTNDYTDYSVAALAVAISKLDYAAYGLDISFLTGTAKVCGPRGSTWVDEIEKNLVRPDAAEAAN